VRDRPRVAQILADAGGVATAGALLRECSRRDLAAALREGQVVRLTRGTYGLPLGSGPASDLARAAALACHGVISHQSAAEWHRWDLKADPERPVVTVPRGRKIPAHLRERYDVRWGTLGQDRVVGIVTTPVATVVDCARSLPFDEALVVADSALRSGLVTREALLAAALAGPRSGRPAALRVTRTADGRAANAFESVVRAISLDVDGLALEPQRTVAPSITCDLVDEARRIVVECDSWTYHAEKSAFHRDLERYNALALDGWLVLRFDRRHAMDDPDHIRRQLVRAARARTDHPPDHPPGRPPG
jgi:very-short-patch-repair endonuclease